MYVIYFTTVFMLNGVFLGSDKGGGEGFCSWVSDAGGCPLFANGK